MHHRSRPSFLGRLLCLLIAANCFYSSFAPQKVTTSTSADLLLVFSGIATRRKRKGVMESVSCSTS